MTDEKRLQSLTHGLINFSSAIDGRTKIIRRALAAGETIDLEKLLREMDRWSMKAHFYSLHARGADEAAAQMHAEIHAHYREDYPLRDH